MMSPVVVSGDRNILSVIRDNATVDVPDSVIALPAFDDALIVVRANVVPDVVNVPIPTSQDVPLTMRYGHVSPFESTDVNVR